MTVLYKGQSRKHIKPNNQSPLANKTEWEEGNFAFSFILNSKKNKDLEKKDGDLIVHKNST